jgi:hypothetical protein
LEIVINFPFDRDITEPIVIGVQDQCLKLFFLEWDSAHIRCYDLVLGLIQIMCKVHMDLVELGLVVLLIFCLWLRLIIKLDIFESLILIRNFVDSKALELLVFMGI